MKSKSPVIKCSCGNTPHLDKSIFNPPIFKVVCECGCKGLGELGAEKAIENWNRGLIKIHI